MKETGQKTTERWVNNGIPNGRLQVKDSRVGSKSEGWEAFAVQYSVGLVSRILLPFNRTSASSELFHGWNVWHPIQALPAGGASMVICTSLKSGWWKHVIDVSL